MAHICLPLPNVGPCFGPHFIWSPLTGEKPPVNLEDGNGLEDKTFRNNKISAFAVSSATATLAAE